MISKEEVIKIAKLARLELTEKEVEHMQKDLSSILDYFNLLKKTKPVSKKAKKDTSHLVNVLRKDEAKESNAALAGELVNAAPDKKDGYIKVKAVL